MCRSDHAFTVCKFSSMGAGGPDHTGFGFDVAGYSPRVNEDAVAARESRQRQRASMDPEEKKRERKRRRAAERALKRAAQV